MRKLRLVDTSSLLPTAIEYVDTELGKHGITSKYTPNASDHLTVLYYIALCCKAFEIRYSLEYYLRNAEGRQHTHIFGKQSISLEKRHVFRTNICTKITAAPALTTPTVQLQKKRLEQEFSCR